MIRSGWIPSGSSPLNDFQLSARFGYEEEREIKQAVRIVKSHTMTTFQRLASLWLQVRYLDRYSVTGSMVECGVWKGGAAGLMALAHLQSHRPPLRELHLLDSWEGLPEPQAGVDGAGAEAYANGRASGSLTSIGQCVSSPEEAADLLEQRIGYPGELVRYHKGWFQDTAAKSAGEVGDIALLRLDGDWYESTRVCMDQFYPRVRKYGVVIIDDYGYWEGCRRAVDEYLAQLAEPVLLNYVDSSCRYWIKSA
jgi:O-methyltransferase